MASHLIFSHRVSHLDCPARELQESTSLPAYPALGLQTHTALPGFPGQYLGPQACVGSTFFTDISQPMVILFYDIYFLL